MIHRLVFFSFIYIIILLQLSPIIDHLLGELDETKSNINILLEIIFQIIIIVITWFYLHTGLKHILKTRFNITMREKSEILMDFLPAIVLIGLQRNLMLKLEYITYEHPFRELF